MKIQLSPRTRSGFTLIELAMVLFIVSLLIGGLLLPLSTQQELAGRQDTDKALASLPKSEFSTFGPGFMDATRPAQIKDFDRSCRAAA